MRILSLLLSFMLISFCVASEHKDEIDGDELYRLGRNYHNGIDAPPDFDRAREYYLQAVEKRSFMAAHRLGNLYSNGHGVPIDNQEAKKWYRKSIELNSSIENQCLNGLYPDQYLCGLIKKAVAHLSSALYQVAFHYEQGDTVLGQHLKQAFELYTLAAYQNYPEAISAIAHCYLEGIGVDKNKAKAEEWNDKSQRLQVELGIKL